VLGGGVLVLGLAFVVGLSWLLLSVGLVQLPGLSPWVNGSSVGPTRLVIPEPIDANGATLGSRGASVTLTEGQLTTLVSADRFPAFRQASVVIDQPALTVGGYFVRSTVGDPVYLEAVFTFPAAVSGSNERPCQLERIRVGRLSLPAVTVRSLEDRVCGEAVRLLGGSPETAPIVRVAERTLSVQWPAATVPSPAGQ
jgi:hypothetical protein